MALLVVGGQVQVGGWGRPARGRRGDRRLGCVLARDDGATRDVWQTSCPAELLCRVGDLKRWARDRSCAASCSTGLERTDRRAGGITTPVSVFRRDAVRPAQGSRLVAGRWVRGAGCRC